MTTGDKSAESRVERTDTYREGRRRFLKQAGALPAVAMAAQSAAAAEQKEEAGLPQIQLGPHRISRLICGANPFNARSHLSVFVNYEMKSYYTLKRVHDAGMLAGVGTHIAEVVDVVESKGWEVDYYMTCVYERHRSAEQLRKLLGHVPIPVGEVYLTEDPPRMFKSIQQTKRPCLAFKILAAGRLSERKAWVEQAFRDTFAGIKLSDAVIVGIYDRYSDQAAEDAALVRRYGTPAGM